MKKRIALENWELGKIDGNSSAGEVEEWISIDKPSDVHTCLIDKGIIQDPIFGFASDETRWVEKCTWIYRCSFLLSKEDISQKHLSLLFEGLDTYAEVYMNDVRVSTFENMFVEHHLQLDGLVQSGKNTLVVVFPPFHEIYGKKELPEGFWINYSTERAYARKAGYNFGWDWTPSVMTVGIWKPVELCITDSVVIRRLDVQSSLSDDYTVCTVKLKPLYEGVCPEDAKAIIKVYENEKFLFQKELISSEFTINNALLWYPREAGEQNLYTVQLSLVSSSGELLDSAARTFGVRRVEFITEDVDGRKMFLTRVNGRDIFSKGANWVPVSNRPGAVSDEYYDEMLRLVEQAGMNLLILWGGGIYEREHFYEICDRKGILLWQYFMFACGEYPDFDASFQKNVEEEIRTVVPRLDNHPSVIFYIGNVEGEMICQKIHLGRPMYGKMLFERFIPELLKELGTDRPYESSSPFGGTLVNSMTQGDRHNWDVWFSGIPYQDYRFDHTTFASEFGLHAAPALETIRKYTQKEDISLGDYAYDYFNRDGNPSLLMHYIKQHIGEPRTLEEYVEMSMLLQAEALKYGCEHYRRGYPYCGGAAIWQLNDCCGCQSWSMIDYDLIPKASYYYARRFFRPVMLSIHEVSENEREIVVVNNSMETFSDDALVVIQDLRGNTVFEKEIPFCVKPGEVKVVHHVTVGGRFSPNVSIPNRLRHYVLSTGFREHEGYLENSLFGELKDLCFPLSKIHIEQRKGTILLTASVYTKFVELIPASFKHIVLEDNYFDLLPGQQRTLQYNCSEDQDITIKAFNGTVQKIRIKANA